MTIKSGQSCLLASDYIRFCIIHNKKKQITKKKSNHIKKNNRIIGVTQQTIN